MFLLRKRVQGKAEPSGWTASHLTVKDQALTHTGPDNEEHAAVGKSSILGLPNQYFEVTVTDLAGEGCVAVGVGRKDFPSSGCFPGWRKGSYGYHSDDGHKYGGTDGKDGLPYGEPFGKGDTIGCGIHQGSIFFTRNGKYLGVAFRFAESMKRIFPVVALDYPSSVQINLGESPFAFNAESLQVQAEYSDADRIPLEILVEIFSFVMAEDDARMRGKYLISIALTCHWWKSALFDSCSNPLWKVLSQKQWPYLLEMDVNVRNWARFYKTRMIALSDMAVTSKWNGKYLLPIENCTRLTREYDGDSVDDSGLEWERQCPLLLGNIDDAHDEYATSFHCGVCNEQVYRVFTTEELLDRTHKGQCVLYFVGTKRPNEKYREEKMGKRRPPSGRELAQKQLGRETEQRMKEMRLQNRGKDVALTPMQVYEAKKEVLDKVNKDWEKKQQKQSKGLVEGLQPAKKLDDIPKPKERNKPGARYPYDV